MKKLASVIVAGVVVLAPVPAHAATTQHCTPARPVADFYEAGRIASAPVDDNNAACSTIAVSGIRDVDVPADTCQTFLLALLSTDGRDPTYTEPVRACSPNAGKRTVLATGVPAGVRFRVLYQVDYIDPSPQVVRYTVWR